MRIDDIESLVDLVAGAGVTELTLQAEGRRLTIRKAATAPVRPSEAPPPAATDLEAGEAAPLPQPAPPHRFVTAPMVGIFHHSEPPVAPGIRVERGQVVGVIESMKLMNDIRTDASGTVVEVLVEAGMAVEFGQPLIALAP